jgi:hypothetical protein
MRVRRILLELSIVFILYIGPRRMPTPRLST